MIFVFETNSTTMLSGISWLQYIVFLVVMTSAYYGVVSFMFYKKDVFAFINKSQESLSVGEIKITGESILESSLEKVTDTGILQHEIQSMLKEAANKKVIKEEIIMSLQILLEPYPSLQSNSLKELVNNYIIIQTQNICSIHLDEETVNQVWLR